MADTSVIELNATDRGVVVGQTGSGKTYFMRQLLLPEKRLVVADPKGTLGGEDASGGDWHLDKWGKRTVTALRRGANLRARIPTPVSGDWAPYLWRLYRAGDVMLYIDEIYGVVPPRKPIPTSLHAIYTRGRELGIGVWTASQRPTFIPLEILTEAQWFICFRLMHDEDRKRMAQMMGSQVMQQIPDKYGFWMYNVEWDAPVYIPGIGQEERIAS